MSISYFIYLSIHSLSRYLFQDQKVNQNDISHKKNFLNLFLKLFSLLFRPQMFTN